MPANVPDTAPHAPPGAIALQGGEQAGVGRRWRGRRWKRRLLLARGEVVEAGLEEPEAIVVQLALELLLGHPAAQDARGMVAAHDEALVELRPSGKRRVGGEEASQRLEGREFHRNVQARALAHLHAQISGDQKQNQIKHAKLTDQEIESSS